MNKLCARCGKPVYFAERKTSLGREWHPTCLKCNECGRVLAPGQHAEHKGLPYCHHPCYRALFGPDIIGFGSTVSQPKGRPASCSLDYYDHQQQLQQQQQQQQQHQHHHHHQKRVKSNSNSNSASAAPPPSSSSSSLSTPPSNFTSYINDHLQNNNNHHHHLQQTSHSHDSTTPPATAGATTTTTAPSSSSFSSTSTSTTTKTTTTKSPSSSSSSSSSSPTTPIQISPSFDSDAATLKVRGLEPVLEEIIDNNSDENDDNKQLSISSNSNNDNIDIDEAATVISNKHSRTIHTSKPSSSSAFSMDTTVPHNIIYSTSTVNGILPYDDRTLTSIQQHLKKKVEAFNEYNQSKVNSQMTIEQQDDGSVQVRGPLRIYWGLSRPIQLSHCDDKPAAPVSKWRHSLHVGNKLPEIPERKLSGTMSMRRPLSPSQKAKELDDLQLPTSPDDVVRRKKKGVPKFKTVAYRGDEPTKWKRASINGHIFNYDTSVFTPVLGSCTCVNVNGAMDSLQVITTLLEKFKVQNNADEYVLSLVNEEGERLLTSSDRPLLERLNIGPQETLGKLFIKERQMEAEVLPVDAHIQMPIVEAEEEENLPQEVEQLLVLPEAVLKGILVKYKKDEEHDVQLVRARFGTAKKRILNRLGEISFKTSSTV